MARKKGSKNPNAGRKKGSLGKVTQSAREAIAMFVEGNVEQLQGWLEAIAKDNPLAAFDRFMAVVEYHIPKLARTEITGKDGERFTVNVAGLESVPMRNVIDAEFKTVEPVAIEDKTNG